jgi:hypothetical protein
MKRFQLAFVLILATAAALAASAHGQIWSEAYAGSPFGVGRIMVPLAGEEGVTTDLRQWTLEEEDGRTFYPAITAGTVQRLVTEVLSKVGLESGDPPAMGAVYFLFQGEAPLHLRLYTPRRHDVTVRPAAYRPLLHRLALTSWWREFNAQARRQEREGDYPPLIETYLTTMLAQRLGLEMPLLSRIKDEDERPREPLGTLELLMGTEKVRMATMKDAMLRSPALREADALPLPADIAWSPLEVPAAPDDVSIESLAQRVPEECFYLRFGQFANLLWLDDLTEDYGGNLMRMLTLRGFETGQSERMRRQLVLPESLIAEVLGRAVVSDVALIGRDLYLGDGAAVGVILQTRVDVLQRELMKVREATAKSTPGATIEKVTIAGHEVSFVCTPDNRIRSYYAVDGNYNLITTSRSIVERFFATAEGDRSLAGSAEFRHARTLFPTSREDTVFVYFSSAFLRGLVSPQYQIETYRRLEALADIDLVELARMAARAEGRPADTLEDLIAGGFLPRGFGRRSDGSGPILESGRTIDSLRGGRGSLLPVTDVALRGVSAHEAAWYTARAAFYRDQWKQMDPIMAGVRRTPGKLKGTERIVTDINLSGFLEEKYGWLVSFLGSPTKTVIPPAPGDAIRVQAALDGGGVFPLLPEHHLFVGVRDAMPGEFGQPDDLFTVLRLIRTTPGYLGAWPKPGLIDQLTFGAFGPGDAEGYSELLFGVQRREFGAFSVLAFDKALLAEVTPHLEPAEAENEAHVRVYAADLSKSKLAGYLNQLSWARGRQLSEGNAHLLKTISQQLKVPPEDALATAERLLDVSLLCGLDGKYETHTEEEGRIVWRSSVWPKDAAGHVAADDAAAWAMPEGYRAPLLKWFRGLEAEAKKDGDRLIGRIELELAPTAKSATFGLPLFDFLPR